MQRKYYRYFSFVCVIVFSCFLFFGCTNSKISDEWTYDPEQPWNYDPVYNWEDINLEDYDIEFQMETAVYSEMPTELVCTAVNKTGKTFPVCRGLFIEKIHHGVFPSADGELGSAWVRIPFYTSASWGTTARPDITWKQDITERSMQNDFEFTPGWYRLVMFAGDGPHYAYFEITG